MPLIAVEDDEFDAAWATSGELAQERRSECLGLGGIDIHAQNPASSVAVDPTATITASETIRLGLA